MADDTDQRERPEYRVYRARRRLLRRDRESPVSELEGLRPAPGAPATPPRRRRRPTARRVLGWLALALLAWIVVSAVVFLVSAQIQQARVDDAVDSTLGGAGYPLTTANTVLVLGSDRRDADTAEPGAATTGPSRSDSILLLRAGGGANARLSIARDTLVPIPGRGVQKINAAYAIGGPALAVQTIEFYLGVEVNHLIEVSFDNFPGLIDAMGGINYTGGCVVSRVNGGYANGGVTVRVRAGVKTHLNGDQALALARTRKNACNPSENDFSRARRQQKIIGAMKGRVLSPAGFVRLPWIAWETPRAVQSDMSGPTLLGLFGALAVGGTPQTRVLGSLDGTVPEERKQREVQRFLRG